MEDSDGDASDPLAAEPPPSMPPSSGRTREDCWPEDATHTLIEAWGERYLNLDRGNLRQKDWQGLADAVNARHGLGDKPPRTDIQCKNRMDTLKKKYKIKKARVSDTKRTYTSDWPFFASLDALIGSPRKLSPPPLLPVHRTRRLASAQAPTLPPFPSSVPVAPRSKRPWTAIRPAITDGFLNFSMIAAAAAASEAKNFSETTKSRSTDGSWRRDRDRNVADLFRQLARAIERFAETYERVEASKQRQMIELEKQRMQFVMDLEIQRMSFSMDSEIQLEKLKRAKRTSESGR